VWIFSGTHIVGGTLNNNGGFFFGTVAGDTAYLDGSTAAGSVTVNGTYTTEYDSTTYLYGSVINNGNMQVNGGGRGDTYLYVPSSNVTLTGGGTVTLNTTTSIVETNAVVEVYGGTLTNVDNTIQGEGIIFNDGTLVNESGGTINANSTGPPLTNRLMVDYGLVNNTGLMEATNNGTLELFDATVNNAGGNITANGPGASVLLDFGTDIVGGTLNNNGGAFFGTPSRYPGFATVLDGSTGAGAVTIKGTYTSDFGSYTGLIGSIINNGNIQVNGGGGSDTYLYAPSNVTLTGGGTVTLSSTTTGSGGNAYLRNAITLDNVNNTIQGEGIISNLGATIINEAGGTILANSTGSPFTSLDFHGTQFT
jgi:hypothetical protein